MSIHNTYRWIIFVFIIMFGAGCSDQESAPAQKAETTGTQAIEPVTTEPEIESQPSAEADQQQVAPPIESVSADGQKVYQTYCHVCHKTGVANAPKLGDKNAWAPRIAKGTDVMFSSVIKGLNAMPPKGTCMTCSDEELRAAMEYMVEQGS